MPKTKPVGIALLVCDHVYQEPSGKKALMGLFDRILTPGFPARHSRLCIFASVTDLRPHAKVRVDIVHGETDESLFTVDANAPEEVDPLAIFDFTFLIDDLVFKEAGTYFVRLFGNDHPLIYRPIQVVPREKGGSS